MYSNWMEDPYEEWKIQEQSFEENSGKVRWILSKGLDLGKKILATGIVISSAPLVLPPLLVISAFGFTMSVPYGIFLASYACTEKLMSKLLPIPPPPPFLLGYGTMSRDEEEEDVGYEVGDIDMGNEEKEFMDDTKGEVEKRIELEDTKIELPVEEVVIEGEEIDESNIDVQAPPVVLTTVVVEENGDQGRVELTRDAGGTVEGKNYKEVPNKSEEMRELEKVENVDTARKEVDPIEEAEDKLEGKNIDKNLETEKRAVETREAINIGKTVEEENGINKEKDTSMPSNKQLLYDEEKIWEKLNAMRTIVGYKAAPQAKCIEELKAIYVFAGVEPPAAFKEPSDLVEVNVKLQFLMSIVGVK